MNAVIVGVVFAIFLFVILFIAWDVNREDRLKYEQKVEHINKHVRERNRKQEIERQNALERFKRERQDKLIKIKKDTCPKCHDRGFVEISKRYDEKADTVLYYQECSGCGYTKYQNKPDVIDFIEILDKQFKNWEKKSKN